MTVDFPPLEQLTFEVLDAGQNGGISACCASTGPSG